MDLYFIQMSNFILQSAVFFLYRSRIPNALNAYAGGSAVPLQSDAILFLEA